LIECPLCDGIGKLANGSICQDCEDGRFKLSQCPREFVGNEMTFSINLAASSGQGDWPVRGGLLDQSAWFMALRQTLLADQHAIESAGDE